MKLLGFFSLPNPSSHAVALRFTQPLTEMSTRNLLGFKAWPACKAAVSTSSVSRLCRKSGSLDISQPYGPPQSLHR
jgi:hypothetical protein